MAQIDEQGLAYVKYISNGNDKLFQFFFKFLDKKHVKVYVDGVLVDSSEYELISGQFINFFNAVYLGGIVYIRRETPYIEPIAYFYNQSSLNKEDLNKNDTQVLFVMQEVLDEVNQRLPIGGGNNQILNNLDMNGFKILDLGDATDDTDAINLGQVREMLSGIQAGVEVVEEVFIPTEGQTVFELTKFTYTPGYNTLQLSVSGLVQSQDSFTELTPTSFEVDEPLSSEDIVIIRKNDSPSNSIKIKQADYNVLGGVLIARDDEALSGLDRFKAITPAALKYVLDRFSQQDATTEQKGIVQLAELEDSESSDKAATPANVAFQVDSEFNTRIVASYTIPVDTDGRDDGTIWFLLANTVS